MELLSYGVAFLKNKCGNADTSSFCKVDRFFSAGTELENKITRNLQRDALDL